MQYCAAEKRFTVNSIRSLIPLVPSYGNRGCTPLRLVQRTQPSGSTRQAVESHGGLCQLVHEQHANGHKDNLGLWVALRQQRAAYDSMTHRRLASLPVRGLNMTRLGLHFKPSFCSSVLGSLGSPM